MEIVEHDVRLHWKTHHIHRKSRQHQKLQRSIPPRVQASRSWGWRKNHCHRIALKLIGNFGSGELRNSVALECARKVLRAGIPASDPYGNGPPEQAAAGNGKENLN